MIVIYIYPQAGPFFLKGGKDKALLFIHGFTASPSEVYPTAKVLHDKAGYTVSGVLLPGHGSNPKYLNRTGWQDWVESVEEEIKILLDNYNDVFVAGLSMGALLALHAACKMGGLKGAVSINAPIYNNFPMLTASAPVMKYIKPYFPKSGKAKHKELEMQGRFAYEVIPVRAFRSMLQLRDHVVQEVENMEIPLLIMQSLKDESVNPRSGQFLVSKVPRATLVELPDSEHVATMGKEKEIIADKIIDFIKNIRL